MARLLTIISLLLLFCEHAGAEYVKGGRPAAGVVNIDVFGGLVTTDGDFAGNSLLEVSFLVDKVHPVRIGLSSGIFFGSGTAIPILLTVNYALNKRTEGNVPYLGAAVGPLIGVGSAGVFNGPEGVRLAILLRAGIRFPVLDSLDILTEMMLGGLTGKFLIAPQLGFAIHF